MNVFLFLLTWMIWWGGVKTLFAFTQCSMVLSIIYCHCE